MQNNRITKHPVLKTSLKNEITFFYNDKKLTGYEDEMISSALIANKIHIFGHHHKDNSPQGIFCANGQCSQCMIIANGLPVKSCMTPLKKDMKLYSLEGLPELKNDNQETRFKDNPVLEFEVLIIGGGPAGLAAGIELGKLGVKTLIVDDKAELGGKLVLQTHKFFGSVKDSFAGTRGYEIGHILAQEITKLEAVTVWLKATAIGVFSDKIIGVVKDNEYHLIKAQKLLIATGAREKMLNFKGNTLVGVYGAGAFQTLVNRDLVKSADNILIVGGGNVGLIAGYHAIQAGIKVTALIEAMPTVSGYKVHADKLKRLGVPLLTRHTVIEARGKEQVEAVTIAELDDKWQIKPDSYKTFKVDAVLIATGLEKSDEFYHKAKAFGQDVFIAGDAEEIAEASAAMIAGKIKGLEIAKTLSKFDGEIAEELLKKAEVLKARPKDGTKNKQSDKETGVFPVFHCFQEIPCNPCTSVCPVNLIKTKDDDITKQPYLTDDNLCKGCLNCVAVCPGLAITLVDFRLNPLKPIVTVPCELLNDDIKEGRTVFLADIDGAKIGEGIIVKIRSMPNKYRATSLVQIETDKNIATKIAGIWFKADKNEALLQYEPQIDNQDIICRCERVTAGEIRALIKQGITDINQIKAITRAGMGACGGKTCQSLIVKLFKEEGIDISTVTANTYRPLFVEVPLGVLGGITNEK